MSTDYVLIRPQRLTGYVAAIASAAGSCEREAALVASNLVLSNLSGHDSHGVGMMPWYAKYVATGGLALNRRAVLTGEFGSMLMVDGQKGYGQVIGHDAMQLGITRAREHGMALVGLRNSHHLGRIGQWAEDCASAQMVSIHFVNALLWPLVAPFGGSDARFATNPFCVGIPRCDAAPLILDFATSKLALGKVRVAMQSEKPVPEGVLIDSQGSPTTDPRVMFEEDAAHKLGSMLPFGEHKGYGMALICEILGGALTGGETLHSTGHMDGIHNNMLSIIIDPARMGTRSFHRETDAFIDWVKRSPVAPSYDKVRISGEPEQEMRKRRSIGIPIETNTWSDLRETARQVGLPEADIARYGTYASPVPNGECQ